MKTCAHPECNNEVNTKRAKYCSRTCAMKARWEGADYRRARSEQLSEQWQDASFRQLRSSAASRQMLAQWQDPEWRRLMADKMQSEDYFKAQSEKSLAQWQDPEFRRMHSERLRIRWQDPEWRGKRSRQSLEQWQDPDYRQQQSDRASRQLTRQWQDPEWRQFISDRMSGANHPNWQGGTSFEPYGVDFDQHLKDYIRARDGFCCQFCGIPEPDFAHQVHHIDYDKTNNQPGNLILLCPYHHGLTNCNRDWWQELLTDFVSESEIYIQSSFWELLEESECS